jgi:hypothetical protein
LLRWVSKTVQAPVRSSFKTNESLSVSYETLICTMTSQYMFIPSSLNHQNFVFLTLNFFILRLSSFFTPEFTRQSHRPNPCHGSKKLRNAGLLPTLTELPRSLATAQLRLIQTCRAMPCGANSQYHAVPCPCRVKLIHNTMTCRVALIHTYRACRVVSR